MVREGAVGARFRRGLGLTWRSRPKGALTWFSAILATEAIP